jgi:hypothetical protein
MMIEPSSSMPRKPVKKDNSELEDTLRPEYDLASLRVRRLGPGRKSFDGRIVQIEVVHESDRPSNS